MTDYKALCAELLAAVEHEYGDPPIDRLALSRRARAALAEGAGVGVTDGERIAYARSQSPWREWMEPDGSLANAHFELAELLRAAISRFGSHPRHIPVGERLPTEADCDAERRCWWFDRECQSWSLYEGRLEEETHWLPAAAIPLPEGRDA